MGKAFLAGALAVAVAAGLATATPSRQTAARTMTVVIKNRDYSSIDLPPSGEGIGDLRVGNAQLWNRTEKRRVGSFHLLCALTERGAKVQWTTCDFTFRLAGGEITTQGVQRRASISSVAEPDVEAIVGGTGLYAGARGTARLLRSKPDKRTIILRLMG
jgi:hypothetical protein